jgi:hypothetical protein
MTARDISTIEADIQAIKNENPNWASNAGVMALMTQLVEEKNILSKTTAPTGKFAFTRLFSILNHLLYIIFITFDFPTDVIIWKPYS